MLPKHTRLTLALLTGCLAPLAHAENPGMNFDQHLRGDILPEGRIAVRLEGRHGYADQLLRADGSTAPLYDSANNVSLDSSKVSLLSGFGAGASLGTTHVKSNVSGERQRLVLGYGLAPDLTVGMLVAWGQIRNEVEFSTSGATLEANPLFNASQPVSVLNSPFFPLNTMTGKPVSTADVQNILTNPAYGYNYKRLGSTSNSGMLDPVIGMRWRFLKGESFATTLSPSYRYGMAEKRDPDQLFDMRISEGTSDAMLGLEHLQLLGAGFDLQLSTLYTKRMKDTISARARSSSEILVPQSRTETLDRQMGDILESALELGYTHGNWRHSYKMDWIRKGPDRYHSKRGQDISGLEADTDLRSSTAWIGTSWSGMNAYKQGQLPLPLFVAFQYRHALSGRNDILTRDFYLTVTTAF